MSIIYEALKKVQQQFKITPINKDARKNWLWLYLIFIVFSFLGSSVAMFLIFYTPKTNIPLKPQLSPIQNNASQEKNSLKVMPPLPPDIKYKFQLQELPKLPKISLKLNGIIYMNGEYIALINERILKKGEFIEGAQVVKISDKQVDLKFGDVDFNLSLK